MQNEYLLSYMPSSLLGTEDFSGKQDKTVSGVCWLLRVGRKKTKLLINKKGIKNNQVTCFLLNDFLCGVVLKYPFFALQVAMET